jgi:superfamily II DNA or RNA helicase
MTFIQAPSLSLPVELRFSRGAMVAGPWPDALPLPPGCHWHEVQGRPTLSAPGCLHRALCRVLRDSGTPFVDRADTAPALPAALPLPEPRPAVAMGLHAWRGHGGRGLMLGLDDGDRVQSTLHALREVGRTALVLAPAEAGAAGWLAALRPWFRDAAQLLRQGGEPPLVAVASWSSFMPRAGDQGNRFAVVIADACDRVPFGPALAALQCCTASHRLGFLGPAPAADLALELGPVLGPVVAAVEPAALPRRVLHLPLAAEERSDYEAAWSGFLGAYDRFQAMAPGARFSQFVRWARDDPRGRPGLQAWHRALRCLRWTRAKQEAVDLLLARHRGERVLLFTADRESAYACCRATFALPVTAELPRPEREAALAAWARGEVLALAGPRLLEETHGLPGADVGVVVGRAFGAPQQQARVQRVRPGGVIYELVAADTVEVSRSRQGHGSA